MSADKHSVREVEIWERSAEKHEREGRPVAAWVSWTLAAQAQWERDEYRANLKLAQQMHDESCEVEVA